MGSAQGRGRPWLVVGKVGVHGSHTDILDATEVTGGLQHCNSVAGRACAQKVLERVERLVEPVFVQRAVNGAGVACDGVGCDVDGRVCEEVQVGLSLLEGQVCGDLALGLREQGGPAAASVGEQVEGWGAGGGSDGGGGGVAAGVQGEGHRADGAVDVGDAVGIEPLEH